MLCALDVLDATGSTRSLETFTSAASAKGFTLENFQSNNLFSGLSVFLATSLSTHPLALAIRKDLLNACQSVSTEGFQAPKGHFR
jgi:hypothetical protein